MPQVDPELFDRGQFQAELALKPSPIAAFKKAIKSAQAVLDARFRQGRDIRREIEDSADLLRRFPDAKVDAQGRPTALRGPQEYAVTVWLGKDTLVRLPGLRAREGSR